MVKEAGRQMDCCEEGTMTGGPIHDNIQFRVLLPDVAHMAEPRDSHRLCHVLSVWKMNPRQCVVVP